MEARRNSFPSVREADGGNKQNKFTKSGWTFEEGKEPGKTSEVQKNRDNTTEIFENCYKPVLKILGLDTRYKLTVAIIKEMIDSEIAKKEKIQFPLLHEMYGVNSVMQCRAIYTSNWPTWIEAHHVRALLNLFSQIQISNRCKMQSGILHVEILAYSDISKRQGAFLIHFKKYRPLYMLYKGLRQIAYFNPHIKVELDFDRAITKSVTKSRSKNLSEIPIIPTAESDSGYPICVVPTTKEAPWDYKPDPPLECGSLYDGIVEPTTNSEITPVNGGPNNDTSYLDDLNAGNIYDPHHTVPQTCNESSNQAASEENDKLHDCKVVYVINLPYMKSSECYPVIREILKQNTTFNIYENNFYIKFLKTAQGTPLYECFLKFDTHADAAAVAKGLDGALTSSGQKLEAMLDIGHKMSDNPDMLESSQALKRKLEDGNGHGDSSKRAKFDDHWEIVRAECDKMLEHFSQETYGLNHKFLKDLNLLDKPLTNFIAVTNLPNSITESKIREVFSLAGEVVDVSLKYQDGVPEKAIIEYDHPVESVQAISLLDKQKLYGREMHISLDIVPLKNLPSGLSGVNKGLGPGGLPLKGVRGTIELRPVYEVLTKTGYLRKSFRSKDPFFIHYVHNENNPDANTKSNETNPKKKPNIETAVEALGTVLVALDLIPSTVDCKDLVGIVEALKQNPKVRQHLENNKNKNPKQTQTRPPHQTEENKSRMDPSAQKHKVRVRMEYTKNKNLKSYHPKAAQNNLSTVQNYDVTAQNPLQSNSTTENTSNGKNDVVDALQKVLSNFMESFKSGVLSNNSGIQESTTNTIQSISNAMNLNKNMGKVAPNLNTGVNAGTSNVPSMSDMNPGIRKKVNLGTSNQNPGTSNINPGKPNLSPNIPNANPVVTNPNPGKPNVNPTNVNSSKASVNPGIEKKIDTRVSNLNPGVKSDKSSKPNVNPGIKPVNPGICNVNPAISFSYFNPAITYPGMEYFNPCMQYWNPIPYPDMSYTNPSIPNVNLAIANVNNSALRLPNPTINNVNDRTSSDTHLVPPPMMPPIMPPTMPPMPLANTVIPNKPAALITTPAIQNERPMTSGAKVAELPGSATNFYGSTPGSGVQGTVLPGQTGLYDEVTPNIPESPALFERRSNYSGGNQLFERRTRVYGTEDDSESLDYTDDDQFQSDTLEFTNLPPSITKQILAKKVSEVCDVAFVEMDGPGRALVWLKSPADAFKCQQAFHGSRVGGRIIEVALV